MRSDPARRQVLDTDHLVRQCFGDRDLERELLALFLQQCVRLVPVMAGTSDRVERADAAHTLIGAARAVGARRIASLSETLEGALDGDWSDETLDRLVVKLEAAIADVQQAVAERWREAA